MCEFIASKRRIARKVHECMASDWLRDNLADFVYLMTFAEKRALVIARRHDWKILPGEQYINTTMKEEGIFTYKAIPAIHGICMRLDVFTDC